VDSLIIDGTRYLRKQFLEGDVKLVRIYFSSDNVYREYYIMNRVFDRYFKKWDVDGNLLVFTPYRNGVIDGHWQEWNASGACILDAHLKAGVGIITYYYEDGISKSRVDYVDADGLFTANSHCYTREGVEKACPTLDED